MDQGKSDGIKWKENFKIILFLLKVHRTIVQIILALDLVYLEEIFKLIWELAVQIRMIISGMLYNAFSRGSLVSPCDRLHQHRIFKNCLK